MTRTKKQDTRTASVAAEYQYRSRNMLASLSMRHDANDQFDNAVAYHAGIAWAVGPGRLFANVGTGIKNPTFTERYGYSPNTFIGNPDLKPERSVEYEAGYATGRFSFTYFDNRLTDEINGFAYDPARGGFTARNRAEKSHRRGVEIGYADTFWLLPNRGPLHLRRLLGGGQRRDPPAAPPGVAWTSPAHITPSIRFNVGAAAVGEQYDNDFLHISRQSCDGWIPTSSCMGGLDFQVSPRARIYLQLENA